MSSSEDTYKTSAAADDTIDSVVDSGIVASLVSNGNPVLATNLLAGAVARAICMDNILDIDHTDPEDKDETQADIECSLMSSGDTYEFIYDTVNELDTDTQVGIIEGHPSFFETYHFNSHSGMVNADIAITATHAVRDQVKNLLFEFCGVEDKEAKEKGHRRLDSLFDRDDSYVERIKYSIMNNRTYVEDNYVKQLIEANQPVLATHFLASALARMIHLDGCIETYDVPEIEIGEEMGSQGTAYDYIYNTVSEYPTRTQIELVRGNQPFYEKYGFEAGSNDVRNEITYAATHAVRDLAWTMLLKYHNAEDSKIEKEERSPTNVLLDNRPK